MSELKAVKMERGYVPSAAVKVAAAANSYIESMQKLGVLETTYISCYLESKVGYKTILWGVLPENFEPDRHLIKKIRKNTREYRDAVKYSGLPLKGHVTLLRPDQVSFLKDHLTRQNISHFELL